ncbi:hypothetical protein [Mycobacterium sp. URHB0021]
MTTKRRRRTPVDFEKLLEQLTDETEDERRDFADTGRSPFESEHGPTMGNDGDDNPGYARPKQKIVTDKLGDKDITKPEDIVYPVEPKPDGNPAGEMVADGHGFIVNDPRSRPWKTARRTNCAHCGGPLEQNVGKFKCEFEPNASDVELALIGSDQGKEDRPNKLWGLESKCRHLGACGCFTRGCQCSGCRLRWLVKTGNERGVGNPRKYCGDNCAKWANTARNAWKRAVVSAEKRGEEPPPEPEDKGLKFLPVRGLRSSSEGNGHRYVASMATGLPVGVPQA